MRSITKSSDLKGFQNYILGNDTSTIANESIGAPLNLFYVLFGWLALVTCLLISIIIYLCKQKSNKKQKMDNISENKLLSNTNAHINAVEL